MKFNLILSLIFCTIYLINCFDDELKQICKEDIINFNNLEVNSYFHYRFPIPIPKLNQLIINETIKFDDWSKDANEIKEMYQKKDEFNSIIKDFYTEYNINTFSIPEILKIRKSVINIRNYFKIKANQINEETYQILDDILKISYNNLSYLIVLKRDRINTEIAPVLALGYLYMDLAEKLSNDGIFVFGDVIKDPYLENLYSNSIAKFDQIKLNLKDDVYNKFSIYIPFHKFDYNTTEKCTSSKNLPEFYREW